MSDTLAGPHHCIGAARTASDLLFRSLRAHCAANGGSLSLSELESFYSKFISSFSSGIDLFEFIHHNCMEASASNVEMPFAHDKILATMLRGCGEISARDAFAIQYDRLGSAWIAQFFDGFAAYVRQHLCTNADIRLINAYVDAAAKLKATLSIEELLKQDHVQQVLNECIFAFKLPDRPDSTTKHVTDFINAHIGNLRHVSGPHLSRITENQVCTFLTLLPSDNKSLRLRRSAQTENAS